MLECWPGCDNFSKIGVVIEWKSIVSSAMTTVAVSLNNSKQKFADLWNNFQQESPKGDF